MERGKPVFLFLILILAVCFLGLFKNHRRIRAGIFGTDAQVMGLVELHGLKPAWKEDCTDRQMRRIFERATSDKSWIKVDCSFNLEKRKYSDYKEKPITKRLVLEGKRASFIRINCAGNSMDPLFYKEGPVLKIQSEKINLQESSKGISIDSERPENLLIEHCRIKGSIQVGDPDRAGSNPAPTKSFLTDS